MEYANFKTSFESVTSGDINVADDSSVFHGIKTVLFAPLEY